MQRTRGGKSQEGSATVEFALVIIFVITTIFWMLDLSMYVYTYTVMADAAKEGVRYAIVHGCGNATSDCSGTCTPACSDPSGDNVKTQVTNFAQLSFHGVPSSAVTVSYLDGSAAAPSRVQVTVNYTYNSYFALGFSPPTVNASAEGRIIE